MSTQLVVFKLNEEQFAVEVGSVESIIKLQTITKIPHAPEFVVGVTNLRGNIVPVIDLELRLSLSRVDPGIDTRIVVALIKDQKIGMVVDAVSQVVEIDDLQIEPTPKISTSIDSTFIKGIVKIDDNLIILLDLDKVFEDVAK